MISNGVLICITICLTIALICKTFANMNVQINAQEQDIYMVTIWRTQEGDTLCGIAKKFNIDYKVLANFNPELKSYVEKLPEGTFVKIPQFKI